MTVGDGERLDARQAPEAVAALRPATRAVFERKLAYSDERAERYARSLLLPDDLFERRHWWPEHELAVAFNVPIEAIPDKRDDLITWWRRPLPRPLR